MRTFAGQYADNGRELRLSVRAEAGHRCIRCGHPFESGKHGKGEWSPCDEQCTHDGPIRIVRHDGGIEVPVLGRDFIACEMIKRFTGSTVEAQWRILTVHHLDGQKDNDAWWNTLALCQRCHLQIQTKVDPNIPFIFEHSPWFQPYAAGFYAKKYLGLDLTREQVMARLDELLSLERMA